MRAPSCARRMAIPRPMPRLPPVISATRLTSAILLLSTALPKACQYSPVAKRPLPQPRDDDGHIIGLFGSPGPFVGRDHQGASDGVRIRGLYANRSLLQAADAELLAVSIFRLDQAVTVLNQKSVWRDDDRIFFVGVLFHHTEHHAASFQVLRRAVGDALSWSVSGVGVAQRAGRAVIDRNEKRREAVVASVAHQVGIQAGYKFSRAHVFASRREQLAAQSGLKTGHQQSGGNSLPRNVRKRDGHVRRAQLDEIVVIAADGARRLANGFQFHAGNARHLLRKELVLDLAGDGDFILQALALLLFVEQVADGARHFVEGLAQTPQLIHALDFYAVRPILIGHKLRCDVQVVDGAGDALCHNNARHKGRDFDQHENDDDDDYRHAVQVVELAEGREDSRVKT